MNLEMERILHTARKYGASDIHLIAGLPPAWRINGKIVLADSEILTEQQLRKLVEAPLSDLQKENLKKNLSLCYSFFDAELGRFRVAVYLRNGAPELAIRVCQNHVKTRNELGLPEEIDTLIEKPSGLILIAGATGSGKTTTMNYLIDRINSRRSGKIITLEDPIEYVHSHKKCLVVQQELYTDVNSFEDGLIHILRQDPDVIAVGEMRNLDTIETALTAAETGHLVLATLHTASVVTSVDRIVGVFPPAQQTQIVLQLANTLQGVICQQLLPSPDGQRRVLAYELLLVDAPERNIIRENECHKLYFQLETCTKRGMCTMDNCLTALYERGQIGYDALLSYSAHPDILRNKYNKSQI